MNFITKKHLSRRTFLRGSGVTLALPFLESMLPAQTPCEGWPPVCRKRGSASFTFRTASRWTIGFPQPKAPGLSSPRS